MAKLTWLGEDIDNVPGPSFTTCFNQKFHKGVAVEVTELDFIRRAKGNRFFHVEDDMIDVDPDQWTAEEVATLEERGQVVLTKRRGRPPKAKLDV